MADTKSDQSRVENSRDLVREVTAVSRRVDSIGQISTVKSIFTCKDGHESGPFLLEESHGIPEVKQDGNVLTLRIPYSFLAYPKLEQDSEEKPSSPHISCLATFRVQYILSSDEKILDDTLIAFAETNGRLNTVPYWREHLSSSLTRASMPAYLTPPIRVGNRLRDIQSRYLEEFEAKKLAEVPSEQKGLE